MHNRFNNYRPTLPSVRSSVKPMINNEEIKEYEKMQKELYPILVAGLILFLLTFGMFIGLWIEGSTREYEGLVMTLSEMLQTDPYIKTLFIIAWAILVLFTLFVIFFYILTRKHIAPVFNGKEGDKDDERAFENMEAMFGITTGCFVAFSILRLYTLLCIWLFPLQGDSSTSHAVFTSITIVLSIFITLSLLLRRTSTRVYNHHLPYYKAIITLNCLLLTAQVVLAICFAIIYLPNGDRSGSLEFALGVTIFIEPLFIIVDIYFDLMCMETLDTSFKKKKDQTETNIITTETKGDDIPVFIGVEKKHELL